MIPEMEFFKKKAVQTCLTGRTIQKLKPLSALPEQPDIIEFLLPGRPQHFLDLNNLTLRLVVSMVSAAGLPLEDADDKVGIVDAPLHSFFSQVEVFLSEQPVTKSAHLYHYKSICDLYLASDGPGRKGMMSTFLCVPDAAPSAVDGTNASWKTRQEPFLKSSQVELIGKLRADICQLEDGAFILDNVPLRVRLTLNPKDVYLWSSAADKDAKILFHDAELSVPYFVANPELSLGLEQMLATQPATYRFKSSQLKTFLHPAFSPNLNIPIAFSGRLPTSVVLAAVKASDYNGSKTTNPFNFVHCGFEELTFNCNGSERTYKLNTARPYGCTSVLRSLYTELGMDYEETSGHVISMKNITNGKFMVALDLTLDRSGSGPSQNLSDFGTVSVHGRLKEPLNHAICILLYAKFDSVMEISGSREVVVL